MRKRLLTAGSLWLMAANLWGQFINQNNPNTIYYSSSNSYGNEYGLRTALNYISEGRNDSRSVGFNFTERVRMYNEGSNRVEARVSIVGLQTQQVQYRGFDFTEEFTPASAKVDIEIWRNGQKLRKCTHYPKNFSGRDAGEFTCEYQDTASYTNYEIRLVDLDLKMNNNIQNRVRERAEQVDDYYKSADLSNKWQRLINSIITSNPDVDSLDRYEDRLDEVRKEIDDWKRKSFWRGLEVEYYSSATFDPLRVENIKREVEKQLEEKRRELEKLDIALLYADKSRLYFLRDELAKSYDYAKKSTNKSSNHPAGRLMLAKVAIKRKESWADINDNYILACTYSSRIQDKLEWYSDLVRTGSQISNYWQQEISSDLQKAEFKHAMAACDRWATLCKQAAGCVECSNANIAQQYSNITQRWQESLLSKARSQQQTGRTNAANKAYEAAIANYDEVWELLEEYEKVAARYSQYAKGADITADKNKLLEDYYQATYNWAERMYERNELKKSLDLATKATAMAESYGILSQYTADCLRLETKIQQKNFDIHNEQAKQAEANADYAEALTRWESALALDKKYQFYTASERANIEEKNRNLAKADIAQRAEKASNNPLETNEALFTLWGKLVKQANRYEVGNDAATQAAIERLRTELCTRVETNELEPLRTQIKASNRNRDFIQAASKLSNYETVVISYQPARCSFDNNYIEQVKEEIQQCGEFQRALKQAESYEAAKEYYKALDTYEKANVSYRQALVQKNFPDYPQHNLSQYVLNSKNGNYMLHAASHQRAKAAYDDAILLLHESINNGVRVVDTEILQELLAKNKVEQLYVRKKSWKTGLAEALKGKEKDKRWKAFRKAFRRAWKNR